MTQDSLQEKENINIDNIPGQKKWAISQAIEQEIKKIYDLFPEYQKYSEELENIERIADEYNGNGVLAQRNYSESVKFLTTRKNEIFKKYIEPQLNNINYQQIAMNIIPGLSQAQATELLEEIGYDF